MCRASIVALALLSIAAPARAQCDCPAEDAVVIGHRGAGTSGGAEAQPENTIASAEAAFAEGADMIEVDVQLTSDGALVLMHDDTVDRTTDGSGCVSELTLAEVRALDVGGGAPPPTLEELFEAVAGDVNVEVKVPDGMECPAPDLDATVDAVAAAVAADATDRRVLVSSFDLPALQRLRATDASIPIGYLTADAAAVDVATAEGFEALHLIAVAANARALGRAHDAGLLVNVWTVNGSADIEEVLALGVDGVITDTADEAVAARDAVCAAHTCPEDAGAPTPDAGPGGGGDGGGGCAIAVGASPLAPPVALLCAWLLGRRRGA